MTLIVKKFARPMLLCCFFFCISKSVQAQRLVFLFGHALYANPLDKNFNNNYNSGFGVEAGAGIGWGKTFIVGTIGYTTFSNAGKNDYGSIKYVPMKIGLRQYLFSKFVYLHADLGIGRVKNDLYNNQSRFSGDIGAGVKFAGFEVQLDYDGFTRNNAETPGYSSWIGMKAGFNLGL
jgi:hypothetical protein